jgi:phosphoglucomutase
VYKIYAESFRGDDHLKEIQGEAQAVLAGIFSKAASARV